MLETAPDIPGFRITGMLGQGSFGVVYAAETLDDRSAPVAIKVMRAGVQVRSKDVLRFQREGHLTQTLRHEHILPILDLGTSGEHHYIVMERVEGETLQRRMARIGPLFGTAGRRRSKTPYPDPAEELRRLASVCRAADYAHRHGVVHRDIKPGNVLVREDGHPFLIDFGLARKLEGPSTLTSSGVVLGTFLYMAPEQLVGDAKRIAAAADVYALGATLHAMCLGHLPFTARTFEELRRKVLEDEVPRAACTLPKGLEAIWLRALEKEPQHRYASAALMADDLERVVSGLTPQQRGTPLFALRGLRTLVRERRALVLGTFAALLCLILYLGWRARGKTQLEVERLFVEGDLALMRDELSTALERYRAAAELRPSAFESYLRMASACAAFGLRERARGFIEDARERGFELTEAGTDDPRSLYCRALYRLWSEDVEAAVQLLLETLHIDEEFFPSLVVLSRIERQRGDLRAAAGYLEQYRSFFASRYPAWTVARAEGLELEGRIEEALALLAHQEPGHDADLFQRFRFHSTRGRLLLKVAQWEEARDNLWLARGFYDEDAATWANLAFADYRLDATDEALASCSRALALDPSSRTAHSVAAWIAVQRGFNVEAEEHLAAASFAGNPDEARRLREAQELYEESERKRDAGAEPAAIELCQRALAMDREHFGALLALAQDEVGAERFEAAAMLLERAASVAARLRHPLRIGRDLWNTAYYDPDNLLVLAQGRYWTLANLGREWEARQARDELLLLFSRGAKIDPIHVFNYADAIEHSPIEALRDWCSARRWLECEKLASPLATIDGGEELLARCRQHCP
jgi:tetratricopeptide (TPR) repeat protein/predicted Ser/Thr protein kinase